MKRLKRILTIVAAVFGVLLISILIIGFKVDISPQKLEEKYFTPESKYVQVLDAKVHIRTRGSGSPILLLHGSFSSLHTWQDWEDELSKSYTTVSVDFPGHGLTGPNETETYTTDYYTKLVLALADSLKLDTFYVAGNSMGGTVAWKLALRAPERVKKLVLIDAAGFWNANKKSDRPWIFKALQNPLFGAGFTHITPKFVFNLNMKQVYGNENLVRQEVTDQYYELMLREGNREATLKRINQDEPDQSDTIQQITTPTLILWGKKDRWIPVENAYLFHKAITGSTLVVLDEAGHVPMEEIPSESVEHVLTFLKWNN
jgi:pimeloyl-ACP methyl ester carboxylesterase